MNAKDYFKLSIRVRGTMTRYFATRDNRVKEQSIKNEKEMDEEIIRVALINDEIYQYVAAYYPELIKAIEKRRQLMLFE